MAKKSRMDMSPYELAMERYEEEYGEVEETIKVGIINNSGEHIIEIPKKQVTPSGNVEERQIIEGGRKVTFRRRDPNDDSPPYDMILDDGSLPDNLSQGYVCIMPWHTEDEKYSEFSISMKDKYNGFSAVYGIRTNLTHHLNALSLNPLIAADVMDKLTKTGELAITYAIPVHAAQEWMEQDEDSKSQLEAMTSDENKFHGIMLAVRDHMVVSDLEADVNPNLMKLGNINGTKKDFQELLSKYGHSNRFKAAMDLKIGASYDRAAILTALARVNNIPTRIVGFTELPQDKWEQVCEELGEFEFEDRLGLLEKTGFYPSYVKYLIQNEYDNLGEDPTRDHQRMKEFVSGKMRIDPNDTYMKDKYKEQVWVEAKTENGWTTYNTTRESLMDTLPDVVFDKVFDIMHEDRILFPEIRLIKEDEGKTLKSYYKVVENF